MQNTKKNLNNNEAKDERKIKGIKNDCVKRFGFGSYQTFLAHQMESQYLRCGDRMD